MSDILQYRGTTSGSNTTGVTEVSSTNPLPVTVTSGTTGQEVVGNIAAGATDSGNPVKIGGKYNTSAPVLTNGQRGDAQLDVSANLKTAEQFAPQYEDNTNGVAAVTEKLLATNTYAPSIFTNYGANATLNVKSSAGNVLTVYGRNLNAAVRYFQIHNTATVPSGGASALISFAVPAGGYLILDKTHFPGSGEYCSTGIAFAWSTAEDTYTAATAADHSTVLHYK